MAALIGVLATAAVAPRASAQLHPLTVHRVSFSGNHGVDPEFLAASIATTQSSVFVRWGILRWLGLGERRPFNQTLFIGDIERLKIAFRLSGYPDVKVDTIVHRTADAIDITFKITEGTPVRLRSLDIVGLDSVEHSSLITQDLPIVPGDVASDYKLHEAQDTVANRLRNRGYPTASVTFVGGIL